MGYLFIFKYATKRDECRQFLAYFRDNCCYAWLDNAIAAQYFCNPSNLDGRVYVRFRVRVRVSVRVRVCYDNVSDPVIYV